MHANVGRTDARIRAALAVVFLTIAAVFHDLLALSLIAGLLGLLCAGTAMTRNCPLYALLRITTAARRSRL